MLELAPEKEACYIPMASIKVIGVGGAGGNTVNSMIGPDYAGIDFVVANTDAQALNMSKAQNHIQIGVKSTKGLGSGANPEVGRRAAEEDLEQIMKAIGDADIVFLTAGMGGGTGSGALPVIARALKERGILSIAIVTRPFDFEGKYRARVADEAIMQLKKEVDTLVVIPNQKLLDVADQHVSMIDAFAMINDVLNQSVRGIADIITKPGHINVDFADLRAIMKDRGLAVMGTGKASGPERAREAASKAISSPLLENMSIKGACSVLLNITCGTDLGLHEINQAASVIREQAADDANIILGSVIDDQLHDEIIVTVIATGFEHQQPMSAYEKSSVHVKASVKDSHANTVMVRKPEVVSEVLQKKPLNTCLVAQKEVDITMAEKAQEHVPVYSKVHANAAMPVKSQSHGPVQVVSVNQSNEKAVREVDPTHGWGEHADTLERTSLVDIDSLDVPTFLRKEV